MSETVENLTLEHLRADMTRMADYMATLSAEMRSMQQSMAGVRTLQDHDHADLAEVKVRLERIERRLELAD